MAQEYSIWNATIASLQFWTEDLNSVTLGIATECVYSTFFYTSTSQTLCQQCDETLFGSRDEHWSSKETPERTFCIHEHGLPHNLCSDEAMSGGLVKACVPGKIDLFQGK